MWVFDQKFISDDVRQARPARIEREYEVLAVQLAGLAVRLVVDILLTSTESGWSARLREVLQLGCGCAGEVDASSQRSRISERIYKEEDMFFTSVP